MAATLVALGREMRAELRERILPWWAEHALDRERGGFHGLIGPDAAPAPDAPRGVVLNSRILWTFSAAHRTLREPWLRVVADRAAEVVTGKFLDLEHGGVYWTVDPSGRPVDPRKHVYAQAFALYGLSEHHRATGCEASRRAGQTLFGLIEAHAWEPTHGGYREAFDRGWTPLADVRLGDSDLNAPRSHNTLLHLLEAYANLYRVWPDPVLQARLRHLIGLFPDRIVDRSSGHARPFFEADWTVLSTDVSYGHDIETAWLLGDAARLLDDPTLAARVAEVAVLLADTTLREGVDPRGGLFYRADATGAVDREKEWWPQAEAVVGFLDAFERTARPEFLDAAWRTWSFIRDHLRDHEYGEWHRRVDRDGTPQPRHEKAGPWKGPYHNGRACLEVMRRTLEPGGYAADPRGDGELP